MVAISLTQLPDHQDYRHRAVHLVSAVFVFQLIIFIWSYFTNFPRPKTELLYVYPCMYAHMVGVDRGVTLLYHQSSVVSTHTLPESSVLWFSKAEPHLPCPTTHSPLLLQLQGRLSVQCHYRLIPRGTKNLQSIPREQRLKGRVSCPLGNLCPLTEPIVRAQVWQTGWGTEVSFKWLGLPFEASDTMMLSLSSVSIECHPPSTKAWEPHGSLFMTHPPDSCLGGITRGRGGFQTS